MADRTKRRKRDEEGSSPSSAPSKEETEKRSSSPKKKRKAPLLQKSDTQPLVNLLQEASQPTQPSSKRTKRAENEETLPAAAPVVVLNKIAGHTDPGSRYGPLNQDAFFVEEIKTKRGDIVYAIGVFDGHGKHGEKAAEMSSELFLKSLKKELSSWHADKPPSDAEYEATMQRIFKHVHNEILNSYTKLKTLEWDGHVFELQTTVDNVNFYHSKSCTYVLLQDFGTTATVALYFKATKHILVANCGDSDAIVGRKISNGSIKKRSKRTPVNMLQLDDDHYMEAILLTVSDNVMQNKSEIARVRRNYGKKTKFLNGYLSPNDQVYGFHSLAMTRALGHKFLQDYGVLYEPHVTHHRVTEDDHVLIVGSDGLFDVVENPDILEAAINAKSLEEGCKDLVVLALENWREYCGASPGTGPDGKSKVTGDGDFADNTTVCIMDLRNL